jgi:hypothetical protein
MDPNRKALGQTLHRPERLDEIFAVFLI